MVASLALMFACAPVEPQEAPWARQLEVGTEQRGGNIVGIQAWMDPSAFASTEHFDERLREWMDDADDQEWLRPDTVVVLPESIGTWLVLVDEPAAVIEAEDGEKAIQELVLRNLPAFLNARADAPADDADQYALYAMKADRMAEAYQSVMSGIARDYNVTLVAGSIYLPEPDLVDGEIVPLAGRELRNASFVFDRDGNIAADPAVKCFPGEAPQAFVEPGAPGRLPVADSPAGRLGVMVGADSWYPESWDALLEDGAERVIAPVVTTPHGAWTDRWDGYDGWPTPDDVDPDDARNLTLEEANDAFGLVGRALDAGVEAAIAVPLRGEMWEIDTDGQITGVLEGERFEGPLTDGPVVVNVWLPERAR